MPTEWLVISGWGNGGQETGQVPRRVAEALGVDCTPLDRRDSWGRQGTVWFTREQSAALRKNPDFEPAAVGEEKADE